MASDKLTGLMARLGGQGATLSRGRIVAVSTGLLTVLVDGGEVPRVGYLKGSWLPEVGEEVFLVQQAGFGSIALGALVTPAAQDTLPDQLTFGVDPSAMADWRITPAAPGGVWVPSSTGVLTQTRDFQSTGAWFYDAADFAPYADEALSQVEIQLTPLSGIPELVLHRNSGPTGQLDTYSGPLSQQLTPFVPQWIRLPLAWGRALLSGEAQGVAVRSERFDASLDLSGSLRFTTL